MAWDEAAFRRTLERTRQRLLAERTAEGHWVGELATSALATATATAALSLVDADAHRDAIRGGLDWLAAHANADGGWGDTVVSRSNVNTTALCWGAFARAPEARPEWDAAVAAAERWLTDRAGSLQPRRFVEAILAFYGRDRTFSVPILTLLSLCGRLGPTRQAMRMLPQLPFELAALPHGLWRFLRLPVVSYALPALVAIGQARHHFAPHWCPFKRGIRDAVRGRTLAVVQEMQASSGGFLEAVPITSFITACLASIGRREHAVVRRATAFLLGLRRADGGWPIDTCLSSWATTLAVNALYEGLPITGGDNRGECAAEMPRPRRAGASMRDEASPDTRHPTLDTRHPTLDTRHPTLDTRHIVEWLLGQQYDYEHPFTHTPPGAWSWMDADGAVPDADDTPGALIALHNLAPDDPAVRRAAAAGVRWLLDLQNRDGGMPTFCRGWGRLPFDRSAADITAHALRAWCRWRAAMPDELRARLERAIPLAADYLARAQRADGVWVPLWFGNEWNVGDENPTYGTSRVVTALAETGLACAAMGRGVEWLLRAQRAEGGWGGGPRGPASIEETALAVDALCGAAACGRGGGGETDLADAIRRGLAWLVDRTEEATRFEPTPIGFYFAKLWYFERLYPLVWSAGAMERAAAVLPS